MSRPEWIYGRNGALARRASAVKALAEPQAAPWPNDVALRFTTVGGALLDVTGSGGETYAWHCHGCLLGSDCPAKDYLFRVRQGANEHASICRAMPRLQGRTKGDGFGDGAW